MRTDAGYRRDDGTGKDLTGHMAYSPRDDRVDEQLGRCPWSLKIGERKESQAWDAQTVEYYECYLGEQRGHHCTSKELCDWSRWIAKHSPLARAVRTGGLPTD